MVNQSEPAAVRPVFENSDAFADAVSEGDRVRVTYESVYSDEPQTLEGDITVIKSNESSVRGVYVDPDEVTAAGYDKVWYIRALGSICSESYDRTNIGTFLSAVVLSTAANRDDESADDTDSHKPTRLCTDGGEDVESEGDDDSAAAIRRTEYEKDDDGEALRPGSGAGSDEDGDEN